MKNILLVSISIVIVSSTIALIAAFANGNNLGGGNGDMIVKKETAIKIGSALLQEHFPDDFSNIEMQITAEEKDGIWKVYNDINRETKNTDGKTRVIKGGELYVEFQKSNGEILKIGVND